MCAIPSRIVSEPTRTRSPRHGEDAREAVGNTARDTDADPIGAEGNDRTRVRPRPDDFDADLERDNRANPDRRYTWRGVERRMRRRDRKTRAAAALTGPMSDARDDDGMVPDDGRKLRHQRSARVP
jgi:hypothetical protein